MVMIEDPSRGRFYQIGADDFQLIMSLDGQRNVQQAIEHANAKQKAVTFDQENAKPILEFLIQSSLVRVESIQQAERIERSANVLRNGKWMKWVNPVCLRFEVFNPDPIVKQILPLTRWLFSPPLIAVWFVLGIYALITAFARWDQLMDQTQGILSTDRWYWLVLSWVGLKLIHESAHAITCRKYGGKVRRGGILFILFAPLAFVDVTSSWKFASRRERINVSLAGMYAELWIAFVALIVWSQLQPGVWSDICHQLVIMASLTTLLFNANPLMRFDGYFVLSDVLNVANLYHKGQAWLSHTFNRICLGTKSPVIWDEDERWIVASYGVLSFVWRIVLSISIVIAASILWNGLGILLAIIAGFHWFAIPAYRFVKTMLVKFQQRAIQPMRMAAALVCLSVSIFACVHWIKSPALISVPAIVQFGNEKNVRSAVDGFIERIEVKNGEYVHAGHTLFVLKNEHLDLEVQSLETDLAQSKIQARIYSRQGKIANYQAEQKLQESLNERLTELQNQRDKLTIKAPVNGRVNRRSIENLIGSYVKKGELLASIADQQHKEIVASISQHDLQTINNAKGKPVKLVFPNTPVIEGQIANVNPRATDIPIHKSLCATVGGSLPVRLVSNQKNENETEHSEYRLLTPRFDATISIDASVGDSLNCGQRGTAMLKARQTSLAKYAYLKSKQWLTSKTER